MRTISGKGWRTGFQRAEVLRFADRFVVHPISTGERGWGVPCPPCEVLPLDAMPIDLARAALKALAASSDSWPPPSDLNENAPAVWSAYGVKSYRYFDPIVMVAIDRKIETGDIRLNPMKRDGQGHVPVSHRSIRVSPDLTDAEFAKRVFAAIAKSEAAYRPRRR